MGQCISADNYFDANESTKKGDKNKNKLAEENLLILKRKSILIDDKKSETEITYDGVQINDLCDDVLLTIFSYLNVNQRIGIERVCTRWQGLVTKSLQTINSLIISSNTAKNHYADENIELKEKHCASANISNNFNHDDIVSSLLPKFYHVNDLTFAGIHFSISPFAYILKTFTLRDSFHEFYLKNCVKINLFRYLLIVILYYYLIISERI